MSEFKGEIMTISIKKVEHFSREVLLEKLRAVTMLKAPDQFPYEHASITLQHVHTNNLYPAQRYVLMSELQKVRDLEWTLQDFGYSLFHLDGFLKLYLEGQDEPIDLLPPVVELSQEADGTNLYLINDGMHRCYTARLQWTVPQVILVEGVSDEFPYYAFPNPSRWDDVTIIDKLEPGFVKKWHRIPNHHTLYRNFNSAFENVGGPRKVNM